MIAWGRYAEIFDYDYTSGVLSLPEETRRTAAMPPRTRRNERPRAPQGNIPVACPLPWRSLWVRVRPMEKTLYHICRRDEWQAALASGQL